MPLPTHPYILTIKPMSKCQHGQKITTFCASQSCLWKQAGGCPSCIKKYHNHMGPTIFIPEQQAQALIKKFNVDPATKPKCRSLQEAIFNYFNLVKNQLVAFIDNTCMDIINQIGHPYLTQHGLLTTYKRIKKKDYKKIMQKEFRHFYEVSLRVNETELVENEKKIYMEKLKKKCEFINGLEKIIVGIDRMNTECEENYPLLHDGSINLKINQIWKAVQKGKKDAQGGSGGSGGSPGSPGKEGAAPWEKNDKSDKKEFRLADKLEKIETNADSNELVASLRTESNKKEKDQQTGNLLGSNRLRQLDRLIEVEKEKHKQKQKQRQRQKQKLKERQKQRQRERERQKQKQKQRQKLRMAQEQQRRKIRTNSIDKHFTKTNTLQRPRDLSKIINDIAISTKTPTIQSETSDPRSDRKEKQQISPKRKAFQSKQVEINEKKQKLIDMMRLKQESPTRFRVPELVIDRKIQILQQSENKLSENGEDSSFDQKQDRLNLFAHTILPRHQSKPKLFQQSEQVTQKTIIIPVQPSRERQAECVSPLLKYRFKSKQYEMNRNQSSRVQARNKNGQPEVTQPSNPPSPKKKQGQNNQQMMQLTDKQEKSIALLIKSLSVKAQDAIQYLESALLHADDNLSAAEYLSYLYLQLDRPKQCLTICNKMLQKVSHSSLSHELAWHLSINKSAALNRLGRYSQSIVVLEQCLKWKQNAKLYKNLADSYFSIGIFEKSNYYYEKAVALEDNYDEAHYNLAVCLFMQENYHNARFSIIKALHYCPRNEAYLQLQKQIMLRIKDF